MKKLVRLLFAIIVLIVLNFGEALAQNTPPLPPPDKGMGGGRGPSDGGAKLGDGAWILVALVISYGVHSFTSRKKQEPVDE